MPFLNDKQRVLLAVSLSMATLSGSAFALRQKQTPASFQEIPLKPGETFADYRRWKRVNPQLAEMNAAAVRLCRAPTPLEAKEQRRNPHFGKWIFVYVNKRGEDAMLNQAVPNFPVGSVIVKEKRWRQESDKPELLTVMTKMAPGYDSQHGDWQYMGVAGGDARTIQARGKLANCQSCHDRQVGTDYVYRNYLPAPPRTTR